MEQVITRTKHPEFQKQLLTKDEKLSEQEALNTCRVNKASLNHETTKIQDKKSQEIDAINYTTKDEEEHMSTLKKDILLGI